MKNQFLKKKTILQFLLLGTVPNQEVKQFISPDGNRRVISTILYSSSLNFVALGSDVDVKILEVDTKAPLTPASGIIRKNDLICTFVIVKNYLNIKTFSFNH